MPFLAQRNNVAAAFIVAGRYTDAYHELRGVLDDLKHLFKLNGGDFGPCSEVKAKAFQVQPLTIPCSQIDETCFFDSPMLLRGSQDAEETIEGCSCVCSTSLFNMGLVCQLVSGQAHRSFTEKRRWFLQARTYYAQAYEISKMIGSSLLSTALCNNLMEFSFEEADTDSVRFWKSEFNHCMASISMDTPSDVWVHFSIVQVYFLPSLQCARAA